MTFVQVGDKWINAEAIRMIHNFGESLCIVFGPSGESDDYLTLTDPVEIEAFLYWLTEKAPTYVAI